MASSQLGKANRFRALHQEPGFLRDRQRVGREPGANPGSTRLPGAGALERCLGRRARSPGRHSDPAASVRSSRRGDALGLPDLAALQAVSAALSRPFNFTAGAKGRLCGTGGARTDRRQADRLRDIALSGGGERPRRCCARSKRPGIFGDVDAMTAAPELHSYMTGTSPRAP
jgi:hypothetical protein